MAKIRFKKNFSIGKVVAKLVAVTLALYVGNTIMDVLGSVLNGSAGPFSLGFKLLGWTVGTTGTNGTHWEATCGAGTFTVASAPSITSCITAYTGTGILAVIGLVGIASIVMEFVEISMN